MHVSVGAAPLATAAPEINPGKPGQLFPSRGGIRPVVHICWSGGVVVRRTDEVPGELPGCVQPFQDHPARQVTAVDVTYEQLDDDGWNSDPWRKADPCVVHDQSDRDGWVVHRPAAAVAG